VTGRYPGQPVHFPAPCRYVGSLPMRLLPYGRPVSIASIDSRGPTNTGERADQAMDAAGPKVAGRAVHRCLWCGRELPSTSTVGRRRRYCAQACRQRAYENRNALERGAIPVDAVVLSQQERDDLADRLYQMRCAAEDVATALAEAADYYELSALVEDMVAAARSAERIR
jgi:hypothetical protein